MRDSMMTENRGIIRINSNGLNLANRAPCVKTVWDDAIGAQQAKVASDIALTGKRQESRTVRQESALSERDARLIAQARAEHNKWMTERQAGNDAAAAIWRQVTGR